MTDTQDISIRIADCKPLRMTIPREQEERIRRAELNVNQLWQSWSLRYKDNSSHEIMAMVAFRFAELLLTQIAVNEASEKMLTDFEQRLDAIIHDVDDIEKASEFNDPADNRQPVMS